MVTEATPCTSEDNVGLLDEASLNEVDTGMTATTNISELQRLCAEYVENHNRPRSFIDKIAKVFFCDERVHKICRVLILKNRAELRDFDEVLHRVMVVFFESQLKKLRDPEAVYAVIYATANNASREVVRDTHTLTTNHESIEEMQERGEELESSSFFEKESADRDAEIDSRVAAARMEQAYRRLLNGENKLNQNHGVFDLDPLMAPIEVSTEQEDENLAAVQDDPSIKKRQSRGRRNIPDGEKSQRLSKDQQELVKICEGLGLRNQDFAAALDIGLPRLSSYIYGRTASVPEQIMTLARKMRDEDPEARARQERFNRPMNAILTEWAKSLDIDDDNELAVALGVTKMTILRWRKNETKPDQTSLSRYEQYVRMYVNRRKEINERK